MKAHRIAIIIPESHEVTVKLPSDLPPGRAELIVLTGEEEPQPRRRLSVDELLAARLTPPPGVGPVSLADMERAIEEGASGRGDL